MTAAMASGGIAPTAMSTFLPAAHSRCRTIHIHVSGASTLNSLELALTGARFRVQ